MPALNYEYSSLFGCVFALIHYAICDKKDKNIIHVFGQSKGIWRCEYNNDGGLVIARISWIRNRIYAKYNISDDCWEITIIFEGDRGQGGTANDNTYCEISDCDIGWIEENKIYCFNLQKKCITRVYAIPPLENMQFHRPCLLFDKRKSNTQNIKPKFYLK